MAILKDEGYSGKAGNLVFYTMNGKKIMRSKPSKHKTRPDGAPLPFRVQFGRISRIATLAIKESKRYFSFHFGTHPFNKARGWMKNEYKRHPLLLPLSDAVRLNSQFQLNPSADLRDLFRVSPAVSHSFTDKKGLVSASSSVQVSFPAFDPVEMIGAPANTARLQLKIVVLTFTLDNNRSDLRAVSEASAWINYVPGVISLEPLELGMAASGKNAMLMIGVEYEVDGKLVTDQNWLPAGAVAMGTL
jgi:hypothetical protein